MKYVIILLPFIGCKEKKSEMVVLPAVGPHYNNESCVTDTVYQKRLDSIRVELKEKGAVMLYMDSCGNLMRGTGDGN